MTAVKNADELGELAKAAGLDRFLPSIMNQWEHSIALEPSRIRNEASLRLGASKLGGSPDLPESLTWPEMKGRHSHFVAQVNLSELAAAAPDRRLPESGMLYFFVDLEAWFNGPRDHRAGMVVYNAGTSQKLIRTNHPSTQRKGGLLKFFGEQATHSYEPSSLHFREAITLPEWLLLPAGVSMSDHETDSYQDLRQRIHIPHHLLGHADPVQSDMHLECEFTVQGLDHKKFALLQPENQEKMRQRSRENWHLLLQIDSVNNPSHMTWGDGGRIYYWIQQDHLKLKRFEESLFILQSC
jgi:uncharacterized protein YwqG